MSDKPSPWTKALFLVYPTTLLLCSIGITALVADLTWFHFADAFKPGSAEDHSNALHRLTTWTLGIGLPLSFWASYILETTKPDKEAEKETNRTANAQAPVAEGGATVAIIPVNLAPEYSRIMFGRALVGIGFVLLLHAVVNVVGVAGFARAGAISFLFPGSGLFAPNVGFIHSLTNATPTGQSHTNDAPPPSEVHVIDMPGTTGTTNEISAGLEIKATLRDLSDQQRNLIGCVQVLLALGFSVMGALFFFAKSLWDKMKLTPSVEFDERIFWAGLWFRVGAAVVFTLVIYLALLFNDYEAALGWMPFIALIIGLSVKTAESLISGLTERVFAAINALVGR